MKPLYVHYKTTNKAGIKFIDHNKPQRVYIKLVTNGKGKNIKCQTSIYGPGDKKISPYRCIDIHGCCQPVVKWDGIYWGARGRNSYGTSVRLKVTEMNFFPGVLERSQPSRRMLAPNTTPVEEEKEFDDEIDLNEVFSDSDSD